MNEHLKPDIDFEKAQGWANYWLACRVEHASRNMARAYLALEARLANERAKLAAVQDALKFYADKENYIADAQDEPSRADYERGDRARSALRRLNELEKQHGKT